MQDDYDYIFKILIIGESSVGKSSIVSKFADDYYNENLLINQNLNFNFNPSKYHYLQQNFLLLAYFLITI